jgi:hypothetical protein
VAVRDLFLANRAAIVPWALLEALIEPHYPKLGPLGGLWPLPQKSIISLIYLSLCRTRWTAANRNMADSGFAKPAWATRLQHKIYAFGSFCHAA